tara:strand:+ start:278 stop:505 length:228 start_codon:yes stop_codon:yes gene_type:complete
MLKKKSYMNMSNIINEGVLDKIFDFIKKHKVKKLEKAFKDKPEVQKKIKQLNDLAAETEKVLKKYGIDKEIHRIK